MIVYVETNFILEIAFLQEEREECGELLNLAESSAIDLTLPAFSVGEAYEAWSRKVRLRREAHDKLVNEIRQLSRSKPYEQLAEETRELTSLLLRSGEEE